MSAAAGFVLPTWAETQRLISNRVQNTEPEQQKTASTGETETPRMTMADFTDVNSPVWNNVAYDDVQGQADITSSVHQEMVEEGRVVQIPASTTKQVEQSFPDLRNKKKAERTPILRQKMKELKAALRGFLNGLKGSSFEFEVNGNILEARRYEAGIREVMEKITQDKAVMLYHSIQVFQNAQYLYSTPDYDGNPTVYRWNYFYTPVQIGDEVMGVRIAVRDISQGEIHLPESQIYNWNIKAGTALDGGQPGKTASSLDVSSAVPVKISIPPAEMEVKTGESRVVDGFVLPRPGEPLPRGVDTWVGAPYDRGDKEGGTDGRRKERTAVGKGVLGDDVRGENRGPDTLDTRGTGEDNQADGGLYQGEGGTAARAEIGVWAQGHIIKSSGGKAAEQAVKRAHQYIPDVYIVEDAALKTRYPSAWALTSNGVIYISDAVPVELADVVGCHEVVHAVKQRGNNNYIKFIDTVGTRIDYAETQSSVLSLIVESRFPGKSLFELSMEELDTVYDELNAVVWGYHKADPENAKAQFGELFTNYDAYIAELDAIMEGARQSQGEDGGLVLPRGRDMVPPPGQGGDVRGLRTWSEQQMENQLRADEEPVEVAGEDAIMKQSGALNRFSPEAESHAELYFEEIRHMTSDIDHIAEHTGIDKKTISRIKSYLFLEEHDLGVNGIKTFYPDFDIAQSWQRLIDGRSIRPQDLILLQHEQMEMELMSKGMSQKEAHDYTNQFYNYSDYCD